MASAATPAQCANVTVGPASWQAAGGSLGGDVFVSVVPKSARTRFCVFVPPTARPYVYLERRSYAGGEWEPVASAWAGDGVAWFDAATDRYAGGGLWMFRVLIRSAGMWGDYKVAWPAL